MASSCRENPAVATFRAYRKRAVEEIENFINGEIRLIDAYLHSVNRYKSKPDMGIVLMKLKMVRGARAALRHRRKR